MKKIVSLLVLGVVFLTSCTSEDEAGIEETALLKSYEIKKDINGRFTIDYKVNETVVSDFVKNYENGYNEIYLYEGSKAPEEVGKSISSKNIDLNNNELKVGFYENNAKKKSIFIKDGIISLSKNNEFIESSPYLDSYSISDMGNDEYKLIFVTKESVDVEFNYSDVDNIHEIVLKSGDSESKRYSKIYRKSSDKLQIDFVNELSGNFTSKYSSKTFYTEKVPRVIIVTE
ncbi:hypothetical protein [Tenacibaculum geojense]|uniref:Lipoprotein n=1 Tax=Tenacibaculum geojense TaxID=915352 RepID=A0ABW3JTL7_9FLAO